MKKLFVNELESHVGENITFSGFIDTIRDKKWVMFIILRDSTGKVQLTIEKSEEKNKDMIELMSNVSRDSVIKVEGMLNKNDAVKLGGIEIVPENIEILSTAVTVL